MKNNEYFRIDTIEELKEAYSHFEWHPKYNLEHEMEFFEYNPNHRYVAKNNSSHVYLCTSSVAYHFKEIPSPLKSSSKHFHYDNRSGSLYKFAHDKSLNAWEFDIIKRIARCRKKGQFLSDLEKTKDVIDLYIKEYKNETD